MEEQEIKGCSAIEPLNETGMKDVTLAAPPSFTFTPPNLEPSNALRRDTVTVTGWKPLRPGSGSLQVSAAMQLHRH
jgi:hypothetical protein